MPGENRQAQNRGPGPITEAINQELDRDVKEAIWEILASRVVDLSYREYLAGIDLPYGEDEPWQVRTAEKKLGLVELPLHQRESLDKRPRGGSKTFDAMKMALFLASKGFKCIWFSSGRDQLKQPKIYLDYIINNSFLKYLIQDKLKESVDFITEGSLYLTNLTELNARSARADALFYDEESQADEAAYRAGVSILAGSELGMIFHFSTPVKATIFEENHDRLKRREVLTGEQFIFSCTWEDIGFLYKKKEWYLEQKDILPGWYFRQEHEASFELPSGAIFQNVIYKDIPSWIQTYNKSPLVSGLDWNPVAGHWVVGGRWLLNDEAFVVQHASNLGVGYTHQLEDPEFPSTARIYERMRKYFINGAKLCVEDGGINIAYCDWLRRKVKPDTARNKSIFYEEWDSSGVNKTNAVMELQSVRIYCDEMLFPELAKQISDAHWKEDADKPELAKDPADSPHALDGLLHAASRTLRRDVIMMREEW